MNILVVDDNSPFRIFLRKILSNAGYNVILAENGQKAWNVLKENPIDAVITDWMMPFMDGIELIQKIRAELPVQPVILIVTALALKDAFDKAMVIGADEYLPKPVTKDDLLKSLKNSLLRRGQDLADRVYKPIEERKVTPDFFGIGIAASTGGPLTLVELLENLPKINNAAFFIVLHGPAWMLKSFVDRIGPKCKMPLLLGKNNLPIRSGEIYLSPGDIHMVIDQEKMEIMLSDTQPENYVKPSADPLFRTIASTFREKGIGIILTGMGHDGTIGAGYIKTAGGVVIAQDPQTAVIPSMPKSVVDLKIADKVAKNISIPSIISKLVSK